jgi:outer membrane protein assembly factor BamB
VIRSVVRIGGTAASAAAVLSIVIVAGSTCVRPLPPPPTLFPVSTTWVAPIGQVLEGPLATDGTRIFGMGREGLAFALDRSNGALLWKTELGAGSVSANGPALVHRAADGMVSALDPATGKVLWRTPSGVAGPIPALVDGDLAVVVGEGAAALQLASGRIAWSTRETRATSSPAASGPWLFVGEDDGTLRCRDRATGASLWTFQTGRGLLAPPVLDAEQRIFLGTTDRGVVSLDSKGQRRWRWKLGADVQNRPVIYRDTVLVAAHDDVLYALRLRAGDMSWKASLPSRPLSGPILVGSAVMVACYESDVAGFDAETGRHLGALRTPSGLRTPPIVIGDRLYAGLRDRTIVGLYLGDPAAVPTPTPTPVATPAAAPVASPPASPAPSAAPSPTPAPKPPNP